MSEDVNGFKYIMPNGKIKKTDENKSRPDKNGINWDPDFTSYHVEEYCEYYNYDGMFSTDMSVDEIFKNKVCLYEDIQSAMEHDNMKIMAYAYSKFAHNGAENYVAFCAEEDVEGTVIKKEDRVFVNLITAEENAPGIFVVKGKNGYSLKRLDSVKGKRVCGYVCDVKAKYGESKYK